MKQNVNFYSFREAFRANDRMDNFPGNGLSTLFDYLEQYEEETEQEIELDVVALCCDYSQMTIDEVINDYSLQDDTEGLDDDEKKEYVIEYLQDNTLFVGECNADEVIFQVF